MVDAAQYHEISESSHRIMNPFSAEKVRLLGDICQLGPASRVLDLACGKGEMLCMFASERGAGGLGIDKHPPFVAAARARAEQLGVAGAVTFLEGDAANPPDDEQPSGIVSCLGATWIGGGLIGTLELMRRRVTPGGWLLVGEVYWAEAAPTAIREKYGVADEFKDLAGTLDRFEAAGTDLVEMVLASHDDWDRYTASQWLNVGAWLTANPGHPDAGEMTRLRDDSRRDYLAHERRCLGWGVFVLRA